ncbi:Replication initiation protein [Streptococcus gordonii]|uniref:Replication initiation protein n=1 Tax=Streptococcus gordonii TaxID=1302 RepID=A0A139N5U4_STRGN|nr:Replication initiation protein [Streptococcus gordonii]
MSDEVGLGLLPQVRQFTRPLRRQKRGADRRPQKKKGDKLDIEVSLDNITITAYIQSNRFWAMRDLVQNHIAITTPMAATDRFEAYTRDMGRVVLLMQYDKLKGQSFNARPFRLEFNPNKLRPIDKNILDKIITYLEDISISRADLAFDFFELDCSNFILEKKGKGVATKEFRSKTGKLETKYLGASRSEKQIRLYDKKLEQLSNGTDQERQFANQFKNWWRLEFQLRSRSVDELFTVVDEIIFKPNNFDNLTIESQLYLSAMLHDKSTWRKVHRNTKTKYKKLLDTYQTSDIDYLAEIKNLLRKYRPKLEKELAYYAGRKVGQCEAVRPAF